MIPFGCLRLGRKTLMATVWLWNTPQWSLLSTRKWSIFIAFAVIWIQVDKVNAVQIWVADKNYLLAVDFEDMIELFSCIPGSAIGSSDPLSLNSIPLLLFEQTGIDIDVSRFKFLCYSELSDRFDSKSVWHYLRSLLWLKMSFLMLRLRKRILCSWLERCQWSSMNDLRFVESSVYFDFYSAKWFRNGCFWI